MSSARVHPTAVIDPAARLAADVTIGPYAVLDGPVELGPGCVVGPHAHLIGPLTLGARNVVHAGAVLGDRPQHLRFTDPPTGLVAGDDNVFREHTTVHAGTLPGGTRLGSRNYIMASAHVAHDCHLGDGIILANAALVGGHCELDDGAFLSGGCSVHQFTRIGRLAMMSGMSGVSKDIPPFLIAEGRNRVVAVNVVGLKRAGVPADQIAAVREAYRVLSASGAVLPVALAQVEQRFGHSPVVAELVAFIRSAKRGVVAAERYSDAA
jgi:UDP-N-acetylglucosamine acyltransferase